MASDYKIFVIVCLTIMLYGQFIKVFDTNIVDNNNVSVDKYNKLLDMYNGLKKHNKGLQKYNNEMHIWGEQIYKDYIILINKHDILRKRLNLEIREYNELLQVTTFYKNRVVHHNNMLGYA